MERENVTSGRRARRAGFTMAELLVVLTIVAIMSAVAIPFFVQLGAFSRDELNRSARSMLQLLKAAQVYAISYNVNAAVVYGLDNYRPAPVPNDPGGLLAPITDSVTGANARVFTSAAVMYQLPQASGAYAGGYVFAPRRDGEFNPIDGGMVVFLNDPDTAQAYYSNLRPRFYADTPGGGEVNLLNRLGLSTVQVYLDGTGPFAGGDAVADREAFPAHVFVPNGSLALPAGADIKERYEIQLGPSPGAEPDLRLIDQETLSTAGNLVYIPIEIYRATGRVKLGERG